MAETDKVILTKGTLKEKERLLRELKERQEEIGERLRAARDFGDLSENAEYDAAREEQSANTQAIIELQNEIASAEVIDLSKIDKNDLTVSVGTNVEIEDARGKRMTFSMVGTTDIDSLANKISNESPLGEALIGHRIGEDISFMTPSGKIVTYKIVNITIPDDGDSEEGDE